MVPVASVEDAIRVIDSFRGRADEFLLPIADSLLDESGWRMAIITERILSRGWTPDGFEQRPGFRLYRYRASEQVG